MYLKKLMKGSIPPISFVPDQLIPVIRSSPSTDLKIMFSVASHTSKNNCSHNHKTFPLLHIYLHPHLYFTDFYHITDTLICTYYSIYPGFSVNFTSSHFAVIFSQSTLIFPEESVDKRSLGSI